MPDPYVLELTRWREATGRENPGEPVALGCTLTVGRLHVEVMGERFPTALAKSALSTRKPRARKRTLSGCAKLASLGAFSRGMYGERALMAAQRAAWQQAMDTRQWA